MGRLDFEETVYPVPTVLAGLTGFLLPWLTLGALQTCSSLLGLPARQVRILVSSLTLEWRGGRMGAGRPPALPIVLACLLLWSAFYILRCGICGIASIAAF